MGIRDWFTKPKAVVPPPAPPKPKKLTPKEIANAAGEPWVTVTSMNMDMDDIGSGSFDLDWNEIFVARLVKAGYVGKTDVEIVDQWFTNLCRNIAMETFQQELADPEKRANWNARANDLANRL